GRSGPGHVVFFHLWILSPFVKDRSAILPKEAWFRLVSHDLRGFPHACNKEGLRRIDVQYAAGGWAAFSGGDFDGLLSRARPRSRPSVPELGFEPALQQRIQRWRGVLLEPLA